MTNIYTHPNKIVLNKFMEDRIKVIIDLVRTKYEKHGDIYIGIEELNNIINKTTKYRTIETKEYCSGYCSSYKKEIGINSQIHHNTIELTSTVFHEIGHCYQHQQSITYNDNIIDNLKFEQQAEAFSYQIMKILKSLYPRWRKEVLYIPYFGTYCIEFLNSWKGYKQNKEYQTTINNFSREALYII